MKNRKRRFSSDGSTAAMEAMEGHGGHGGLWRAMEGHGGLGEAMEGFFLLLFHFESPSIKEENIEKCPPPQLRYKSLPG